MEKIPENALPLQVEIVATNDRTCVMIMVRAPEPIQLAMLPSVIEDYAAKIRAQLAKPNIDVQKPKIITP